MKILRVIGSMDPAKGGPCQGIRNSISEMDKLGVYNEVVCLDDPESTALQPDPFPIHALGPAKSSWYYSPKLIPWLAESLTRFDVVIIHGLWQYHGHAVSKVIKRLKATTDKFPKVYVMPHGMLDPYFQRARGREFKAIRNWFYWKLIERKVINGADGVLFTCEAELELASQTFRPYKPKRTINVGYGVAEPPLFTQQLYKAFTDRCPQVKGKSYILFLSRIHEKKGVDLLIKAYASILSARANVQQYEKAYVCAESDEYAEAEFPKLVVAGPGLDTHYGTYLQELIATFPLLQNAVLFPGMLSGNAKWGAFYSCEAFVLPSHQENFGIAVAEAMACGKPVLISDQVNIWPEIKANGAGIVAKDTGQGTIELLNEWVQLTPEDKQTMGRKGRETFENYFAIAPAVKGLLNAVES